LKFLFQVASYLPSRSKHYPARLWVVPWLEFPIVPSSSHMCGAMVGVPHRPLSASNGQNLTHFFQVEPTPSSLNPSSRFESLILSHHSRVTRECNKEEVHHGDDGLNPTPRTRRYNDVKQVEPEPSNRAWSRAWTLK
jgi:hypothetical protein